MIKKIILLCAVILIFCIINFAQKPKIEMLIQSSFPPLTKEELISDSELIVTGKITGFKSLGHSQKNGVNMFQTDISVKVSEVLKGEYNGKRLVFRVNDGYDKKQKIIVKSSGYPLFERGDKVLLFLIRNEDGNYILTGMKQGAYFLKNDKYVYEKKQIQLNELKENLK